MTGQSGWYIGGVYCTNYAQGEQCDLVVKDTEFENLARGVYFSSSNKLDIWIEGCTFTSCIDSISHSSQST